MTYPVVDDEEVRLEALRALAIVDTPRTAAFDAIAELAADVFSCPIAFISLLDKDRQWFKAECGLGLSETPRNVAFCNYTVLGTDVLIIEDTVADQRFASNPLVVGEQSIRFYAGVPISLKSGYRIGALCVCDRRSRRFSAKDIERLRQFGKLAEASVSAHGQAVEAAAAAREAAEKAQLLWKKNQLLRQVERIGKIGGWELDLATNICDWSDEVSRIHELPLGRSYQLEEALSFYPDKWRELVEGNIERTVATGEAYDFEAQFVTARGHKKWVRAAGECEKKDGVPARLFGMFQDITLEREASERLWQAANYDELTGLANRRHFNDKLTKAIEATGTTGNGCALMIIDLDNFKEVNDTRGHDVGDAILKEIGRRLQHEAEEGCFVTRLGGDEFAIIACADQSADHLNHRGQRFLARVKQPIHVGPLHIHIGGTIGIARYPADATTAADLLRAADLALYAGKQTHRGSVNFYMPRLATLFERHVEATDLVRAALAQGRLVPFYQPKVRLQDGRCCGFEALARVVRDDGSVVGPSTFGPALEDPALARRVGKQMLTAVTADMASWQEAGLDPVSVSLNAAEADFTDGKLVNRVLQRLDELGLQRSRLTIEVTESVFLGDEAWQAREVLEQLDREGIKVELDDFGTGYASLTHLRAFPVSRLKIDRSFIEDLGQNAGGEVIVQAVIDLGHNLGCEIVAEGVETELQAKLLRDMGCDIAQGFLFGHPSSADATRQALVTQMERQQERLRELAKLHGKRSSRLRAS
jgi:diguanylate cyclase (GGDEF)-like protein